MTQAMADYQLTVKADSGYESTTEGRCTSDQYAQAIGALHGTPLDMVLYCPKCGLQHIDAPDTNYDPHYEGHVIWKNPPHRSHLCGGCGYIWRPACVPTNGVAAIKTKGKADSPGVDLTPEQQHIAMLAVRAHAAAQLQVPAAPGMAVQALAAEIVEALLADAKDDGYDLTAGMFGPAFSALVRRWAALEYAA